MSMNHHTSNATGHPQVRLEDLVRLPNGRRRERIDDAQRDRVPQRWAGSNVAQGTGELGSRTGISTTHVKQRFLPLKLKRESVFPRAPEMCSMVSIVKKTPIITK